MISQVTLIIGGARSGKSRLAELLAAQAKRPVIYIATAQVLDEEMALRVQKHRRQRPADWRLIEEPQDIYAALQQFKDENALILLDCVTLWLSNLLLAGKPQLPTPSSPDCREFPSAPLPNPALFNTEFETQILDNVRRVSRLAREIRPQVIFVTNEVGQGIVPESPLARAYRDLAGRSNQILAADADLVYLVAAGLPLEIKQAGANLLAALLKED